MIIKNYGTDKGEHHQERRYSAPEVTSMQKMVIAGYPDPDLISTRDVIRKLHGTDATHVATVPIKEEFQGQTIWEGEVEVFDLHDHPQTHRVYAWAHETEDADHPRRHVTVLHIPPATSPRKAVQASIVSDYKEQKGRAES